MAASDTAGLVIAGIIGAGGAIITQIVGSVVGGRREKTRLSWEREQEDRAWERRKAERFLDLKRELYSEFGALSGEWAHFLGPKLEGRLPEHLNEAPLQRVMANIDLIAPREVSMKVGLAGSQLFGAVHEVFSVHSTRQDVANHSADARLSWVAASKAMRADLQGDLQD